MGGGQELTFPFICICEKEKKMTHRAVEAVMMQRQGQFAVLEAVAAFCEDASDFASVRTASEDGCDGDTCRERHPEGFIHK